MPVNGTIIQKIIKRVPLNRILILCFIIIEESGFVLDKEGYRLSYGPSLENIVYIYLRSLVYQVSVGIVGALECDFVVRNPDGIIAISK